ncbi:hypothetical protein M427DRAFT_54029 [Gonapodya prolifera JEL478]|uniref:O-acyltransferase n=1 Tax=Gonapodya prolifera (strain JEL478) TaxID=1344416 RepID=A0A139ANI6_GONPJ|nr:hypothetical protein M427DRAFT_54029 [Gonapodya prolifera JEL478]|eukprot:KXS18204.1 hypothetical protein M427DRAFT_54029 [Gonapodya prolifera JEL478]
MALKRIPSLPGVVGLFSSAILPSRQQAVDSNLKQSSSNGAPKKRRTRREVTAETDGGDGVGKARISKGSYSHSFDIHTEVTFSPFDKDYGIEFPQDLAESSMNLNGVAKPAELNRERSQSDIDSEEEAEMAREQKERAQKRVATGDKLDLKGFWNLSLLLLFVQNLRLIAENYIKYGLLISIQNYNIATKDWICLCICYALMPLHLLLAVCIEKLALRFTDAHIRRQAAVNSSAPAQPGETTPLLPPQQTASKNLPFSLTVVIPALSYINALVQILVPVWIIWEIMFHPAPATLALFFPLILFLKLLSYYWVNDALRVDYIRNSAATTAQRIRMASSDAKPPLAAAPPAPNPARPPVTFSHAFYFWFAPTLCYQTRYPRTKRVRRSYVFKRILEMAVMGIGMWFLMEQYAVPTLKNAMQPMRELSGAKMFERLLKLSFSSLYIWLGGFYFFFHSFLNFTAELLRFGDRTFYLPWWNSASIAEYWRLWNIPVYTWAKRHIYLPMVLNQGWKPWEAQLVVFGVSAILHEVVVGIPTHLLYGWAFFAMAGQIPLIWFTQSLQNLRVRWGRIARRASKVGVPTLGRPGAEIVDTFGNMIFWVSFCIVGQPLAIMLYYREWNSRYGSTA